MRLFALLIWCFTTTNNMFAVELKTPIDCKVNKDCFIQRFVDVRAGKKPAQDFMGTQHTQRAGKGTSFRLKNVHMLYEGVPVLAAASGIVKRVRDFSPDFVQQQGNNAPLTACGNGIIIEHGDGLETQYCHLKMGSLKVKPGDPVAAGQKIAEVGMSGSSNFPHLYFLVRCHGTTVDPFSGALAKTPLCKAFQKTFWTPKTLKSFTPIKITTVLNTGVTELAPTKPNITLGKILTTKAPDSSKHLYFWSEFMGTRKGDKVIILITDPDGKVFSKQTLYLQNSKENWIHFIRKKQPPAGFKVGIYIMRISILRAKKDNYQAVENIEQKLRIIQGSNIPKLKGIGKKVKKWVVASKFWSLFNAPRA